MPFRPPNFSPVLPLSRGAALSQTLAGVLDRFGQRKDRERQQRQELLAALELQNLKNRNAMAFEQFRSQLRTEEGRVEFEREAPERLFKRQELSSEEFQKQQDRLSREKIAGTRASRATTQDRVAQRAIDKENRLKKTTFGGRNLGQLSDDIRSTRQLPLRDESGDPTGKRGFETPEHQQQHEFNKTAFELRSAGLSDFDLEQLGISSDEAISQYTEIKQGVSFPTLRPGKPGQVQKVSQSPLSNPEIVELMKAGLTMEMINNGVQALKQNPKYANWSDGKILKLLLFNLKK